MAVSYKLIPSINPGSRDKKKVLLRPSVVINEIITPDVFLERFSQYKRFSKANIVHFMYSLQEFLLQELKEGNIVQTGAIGTFFPLVTTKKEKTKGAKNTISNNFEFGINYRPSLEMKKEIVGAELERITA